MPGDTSTASPMRSDRIGVGPRPATRTTASPGKQAGGVESESESGFGGVGTRGLSLLSSSGVLAIVMEGDAIVVVVVVMVLFRVEVHMALHCIACTIDFNIMSCHVMSCRVGSYRMSWPG